MKSDPVGGEDRTERLTVSKPSEQQQEDDIDADACVPAYEASLMHLLHRASKLVDALFLEKQLQLQPLTPRQLVVLSVIAREGEVNQNQIVQQTGIDRSTMADVIHRLSDRNIINRKRSARDARTDAISLSPMGEALLQNNRATFESTEEVLTEILTLESKSELVQVLKNLVNCLDERSVAGIRTRPR